MTWQWHTCICNIATILRCPLPAVPAAAAAQVISSISQLLPDLTVGLIATLTTVACIIAADTGAYFVGKNLGRTKLTDISPKKTVEGALGGLASAVAVAVLFWKLFSWPGTALAAAGYGVRPSMQQLRQHVHGACMHGEATRTACCMHSCGQSAAWSLHEGLCICASLYGMPGNLFATTLSAVVVPCKQCSDSVSHALHPGAPHAVAATIM
jgi:CDP-diglyceride synthetase